MLSKIFSATQISFAKIIRYCGAYSITYSPIPAELTTNKRRLVVSNHQSRVDPFIEFSVLSIANLTRITPIRFMSASSLYYSALRPIMFLLGCYPTQRKNINVIEYSKQLFDQGYSLFIFPEGRRTTRKDSSPRDGVLRIAELLKDSDAQIVLIHIEWSKRGWRRHADVTFDTIDSISGMTPKQLMDRIYSL